MKRGKLYIKIYLSFILILFVTEMLIFVLFIMAVSSEDRGRFRRYISAQVYTGNKLIEEVVNHHPGVPIGEIEEIKEVLEELGRLYGAKLWIQDKAGVTLVSSSDETSPDLTRMRKRSNNGYNIYTRHKRTMPVALSIPISLKEREESTLYIFLGRPGPKHIQTTFIIGLLLIGAVTALLLLPLSRYISKPLERLSSSALRIAEGNLEERAMVKSRDEIGDLVNSFNIMAEKVERMIHGTRELTANISHQLRTPLARIQVAYELISEKLKSQNSKKYSKHLMAIKEEIEEMDRLIDQVLLLSKLEMQRESPNLEEVDIVKLLRILIERFTPSIKKNDILIELRGSAFPAVPQEGDTLHVDRKQLETAFSNLFDNAVKFTPSGGRIRVSLIKKNDGIEVEISNNSKFLTEDELERIFEPFYRPKGTKVSGTGLGLAITKRIIENHSGWVKAFHDNGELRIKVFLSTSSS